ncbi:LysR family transcriptional regulator [Streptomyces sp. NPDC052109]|uniref:LysR family transcriptional regulator n=1 Tax=Streptomyces sp. NPDC052109 TaxID=3155527 RepID=UPI00343430E8
MDIDLRHLRYFVALAEEEHFSRAAAVCRISQPTLTRAVRSLETALGVRLVDRTTRSVALTGAGRRLSEDLREILERLDGALQAVRSDGSFKIGFTWLLPGDRFPAALNAFEKQTGARVELVRRDDRLAGVDRGVVDAAVLHGAVTQPGLRVVELRREPRVAAVSRYGALARRRRLRWSELARHPLVVNTRSGTVDPRLWPDDNRPRIAAECQTFDECLEMVAADRGVGVVPESARLHTHPGLRYIAVPDAPPVPLVLVCPARGAHPLARQLEEIALRLAREDPLVARDRRGPATTSR